MKDGASPRDGWLFDEYIKNAPAAKADEFGAIFFHIRELLLKFCSRLRSSNISFRLFNVDARNIGSYLDDMKFDRIEVRYAIIRPRYELLLTFAQVANICDRAYVGPQTCLQLFSQLLKPSSQNPKATLLMLFINAAAETDHHVNPGGDVKSMKSAMERLNEYLPLDKSQMSRIKAGMNTRAHPDVILRTACCDMFKPWDKHFDMFMEREKITEVATLYGMAMKKKHTIVQPWPYKIQKGTTKKEFDILLASCTTGFERYMEFQRLVTTGNDVSVGLGNMQ
jgi:hypothetical protein